MARPGRPGRQDGRAAFGRRGISDGTVCTRVPGVRPGADGRANIYDPQYVVVVDESLLETVDVTAGLKKDGAILINTARPKEEILPHLKGYE